jgi:hypothetical protein
MKSSLLLLIIGLLAALSLTACGREKIAANNDPVLQKQADVAKASLQEKADALARQASMSPPPPPEKKK